jgi:hypothetical protein
VPKYGPLLAALLTTLWVAATPAAEPTPAVTYDSFLNTDFYPNGSLMLSEFDLAFLPEGPANVQVAVVDAEGKNLGAHRFYPDARMTQGAIRRLQVEGTPQVQLTEPGVYGIVVLVDSKPVSRFPFALKEVSKSDDPFNPSTTYGFVGMWERLAYFGPETYQGRKVPELNLWLGGLDMSDPTTFRAPFMVLLRKDGEVIAHSKRRTNSFQNGHYRKYRTLLYQPHDEQAEPNAVPMDYDALLQDGSYELVVMRSDDQVAVRRFVFEVTDGAIEALPQTKMDYEPRMDYIAPRVPVPSSSSYEFHAVDWISTGE